MVEIDKFACGVPVGVEQAGDQAPLLMADGAVGQGDGDMGLDDACGQQGGQNAVAEPG